MTTWDLLNIVAIACGCAVLVGALGAITLRLLRRRSIVLQTAVVAIGAVAATLSGITGVAAAMFLSMHDFAVVICVCAVSGLVAILLSLILSRELSAAGATLSSSRERERTIESSRRELVAWISHDLQAPLTGLLTMTEALEDGTVTDVNSAHRQLRTEIDRVAGMVDDLVELSHTQTATPSQSRRHAKLHDLLDAAIAGVEPVARARSIAVDRCELAPVAVHVDAVALTRALSNVLLGAVRHTPAMGAVTVRAGVSPPGHVAVTITDGCGSAPQQGMRNVFDTAWRGGSDTAADSGTTDTAMPLTTPTTANGVHSAAASTLIHRPRAMKSMAAVKAVVEAAGGTIAVTTTDAGCRFEIMFPLASEPL